MAERRMFAKTIIDSDAFLEMPMSARLLYYDLGMRADDDGFVNSPKKIMRVIGASNDDMNILIMRKFIIPFDNGIVVIKHWRINNYLRSDRYSETKYIEQKKQLSLDNTGKYHLLDESGIPDGIPTVSTGKDRIDKDTISISKDIDRQTADAVQRVISEWNALSDVGIAPVSKISKSSKRYINVNARIKEHGEEEVIKAIRMIRDCDFLLGRVKDFVITFDWFVKPTSFDKVHDGNFLNKDKRSAYLATPVPVEIQDEQYADYQ